MFIYLIVNHKTGKYYVGQHKGNNLKKYLQTKLSGARHQKNGKSHLFNAMRKYPQATLWSIHALRSDIQTRGELDETERDFIKFLKAQGPEYGYNICRGGEGFTGPCSKETRQKISIHSKKMWEDSEFRIRQSEAMKRGWADEERSKQAEIAKRRWSNPEFKDKLSEIQKKSQIRVEVVTKKSKIGKEIWSDSERLAKRGKKISEALSKPEEQIRRSEAAKKRWTDPEYRASMSKLSKELWSDPNYLIKMSKRGQKLVI